MVGLPGSGKTQWAQKHTQENREKRYNILGTETVLHQMRVSATSVFLGQGRLAWIWHRQDDAGMGVLGGGGPGVGFFPSLCRRFPPLGGEALSSIRFQCN